MCASHVERARVNVTRAIKTVVKKIATYSQSSGWYLSTTIKTGQFCVYLPDPRFSIAWQFTPGGE